MSSSKRRKTYTTQEALNLLINDSDSEGIAFENDSDMSSDESGQDLDENSSVNGSTGSTSQVPSGKSDSSESDSDDQHSPEAQPNRGRGNRRGMGRGRNRVLNQRRCPLRGRGRGRIGRHARQENNAEVDQEGQNPNAWDWYDILDPYTNEWLPEFSGRRGILVDTAGNCPVDYFNLFFPNEAFMLMSTETNRYANQFLDRNSENLSQFSRFRQWQPTDTSEMKAFTALQLCMGMCKKNEIEDYWSKFWLTRTAFQEVMPRNRYELLSSFLHFADNEEHRPGRESQNYDPLWKIRPLMNIVEPTYMQVYGPDPELSIDESLIRFKGRVSFRQYLPSKPYKWGLKQYVLCESRTGYALKFITYTGKGSAPQHDGFSVTESICLSLLEGFSGIGHKVYTDNFYSSPTLFRELQARGIGASGTVKPGRKGMPEGSHPKRLPLQKGDDPVFQRSGDLTMCAWHDTRRVHFISTTETNNTVDKRIRQRGVEGGHRTIEKPVVADVYNSNMGGVDLMDQKLCTYAYPHKSVKWYDTIHHRLREVALINAYIVYSKDNPETKMIPRVFREAVVNGLLEGFEKRTKRMGRPSAENLTRLTERHFVGQFDDNKYKPDCVVCSSRTRPGWKRKQTNFKCKQCDLAMCFIPCFEIYHTKKHYHQEVARVVYKV